MARRFVHLRLVAFFAVVGSLSAQEHSIQAFETPRTTSAAPIPDYYGGWPMWWSTNREEFFASAAPAADSRPGYAGARELVTGETIRRDVIPVLRAALKDGERQIREAAAIALGMCGDGTDARALIAVLEDKDRAVAEAAVMGLGMLGSTDGDKALGKLLEDSSESERKRGLAALSLGLSGTDEAKSPLLDGLGSGKSDKLEACRMLGSALWTGCDTSDCKADRATLAASHIHKALTNQESKRRKLLSMGSASLCKTRDQGSKKFVLELLQDTRFDVRAAAAIAAGRIIRQDDKAGVHALIRALAEEGHTLPSRFMIISLGRIGGAEAVEQLKKEVASGEKIRSAFAALAVGIAGATDLAPRLRQAVSGPTDERVRGAVVIGLGLMRDAPSSASIAQIALGKPSEELLSACTWYFALSRSPDARTVLEKILGDSRVIEVQDAAATALGILGAPESQPLLSKLLFSGSPESLRKAAAAGLGRMRDQRGLEPLLKVAKGDKSVAVRAAAIAALGAVGRRTDQPPFARVAIDAYYGIQNEAIDEVATRAGSLMKKTEEGGGQQGK